MTDCIFCKISNGELPTNKVYENEHSFAFLDKHPINPGHILVIPKSHQPDFYKLDDTLYREVMMTVKKLSSIVAETMKSKKVGLIVAGFDVAHTHIHIVPMHDYHDITSKSMLEGNRANPTQEELKKIRDMLTKYI